MMRAIIILVIIAIVAYLTSCSSVVRGNTMHDAKISFAQKNYKKSYKILLPFANRGNRQAQYAVGYLHYYGLGTSKNKRQALYWIKRSARRQNRLAKKALHEIHMEDHQDLFKPTIH
jgi:TPR repeat protein